MFNRTWMPERTRIVYDALKQEPLMSGFILIGGTALSIQIGHRLSEDLDFWLPASSLSTPRINSILANLHTQGYHNQLVTPAWQISQAKINGIDLLIQSRDHVIAGVKVTFFARLDVPYTHFATLPRSRENSMHFDIMSQDGIFRMKSWLISQRTRSRDLYDLMVLTRDHGKSIEDILTAGLAADPSFSKEYAKDVLLGTIPLDAHDEGFASIGLDLDIKDIHAFFHERINHYEITLAQTILTAHKTP
ncbi:Nucleotidyl transferase AbiEii toxin, Type IV TA system [Methylobacillus rhizosphaerae]|uniref:Nucleotidyl transferase AbiEii toxin, Type IV TA system n=1 Tax=Methylobacillus rhizosphaerae TaxID=551994 RepID=A0A238YZM2_9PROT|nr:nucleotidyl transferase AbiEii/AbiGii toxin family protein [Methylobacillus rhizosphaerae]SNR76009.1 Nucleotidyl transferase AbiEii toxin, Type IV TA system [Methylobacillus rhizosphaerae]